MKKQEIFFLKEKIKKGLKTTKLGQTIYYELEMDSTNQTAKKLAKAGAEEGTLVIAERQTAGKGRLGRSWESPSGTGIWMSIVLRPRLLPEQASMLTLLSGLSLAEAIKETTGLSAKIKWPNDVLVNGKKICGILTEMSAEIKGINYVILGIGINVNIKTFPEELPYASSLLIEGKKEYAREDIIKSFLEKFEKEYMVYKNRPSLEIIKKRYEEKCITLHKKVKLINKEEERIAQAIGINEKGALIVKYEDDSLEEIISGEVSVRGLYGYV